MSLASWSLTALAVFVPFSVASARPAAPAPAAEIQIRLSEWKIDVSSPSAPAGPVRFIITNVGAIPHGFEIEGRGLEKEVELLQPGSTDTLDVTLKAGRYEIYCPVGNDSHKKLGMETTFTASAANGDKMSSMSAGSDMQPMKAQAIAVAGAGPVIQILPGPFPFPDSAAPILKAFGDEREGLESQVKNGPYSNNVAAVSGQFTFTAWDFGPVRDSVDGRASFTTQDGAKWRLELDRVQTRDVLHHPRFGGVIMGLYYHGVTQVHTPLVPTINSRVAMWTVGHLYRGDSLVTDNAQVHVMLLSRTRHPGSWALDCWDCSRNPVEELQLQILPGPGEPKFDAPGGFLFLNWEKSTGKDLPVSAARGSGY